MRYKKPVLLMTIAVIGLLRIALAQVEFHGFFRNFSAFRLTDDGDAMVLRNRMRLNSELWGDNVYGFASVDFLNDAVAGNETKLTLREAYLDIYGSWLDFRIGKQQVVWGKADGYFINDIVNPLDLSLFLLQDFEDIRMATTMLNMKIHHGNNSLEFLMIPEFRPMNIDFSGNWAFYRPDSFDTAVDIGGGQMMALTLPLTYQDDVLPRNSLKNMEYGLKFNTFVFGTDMAFIYLKAREDQPKMSKQLALNSSFLPESLNLTPTHPWFTFYGMNFSRSLGMFVIRGEGGYYPGRLFDYVPADPAEMATSNFLLEKPFMQAMLGADYQLTGDISIAVQGIQERILDYDAAILNDEITTLGSFLLTGSFANQTIAPMWLTLYNFTNDSYLSRISVDWRYSDSFTITLGTDILGGDEDTVFGQFDKNDNLYLKLKYYF